MPAVDGSVITTTDAIVRAEAVEDDPEEEGAVPVFAADVPNRMNQALGLRRFDWRVLTKARYRMLTI